MSDSKDESEELPLSPVLVASRSTAGPYVCVACCSEGQLSDAHFDCVNDPTRTHSQCLQCFATYVGVCCEQSSMSNTIPIKCPIPSCAAPVPVHLLAALILHSDLVYKPQKPLLKRYEQAQLQVALSENIHKKKEEEQVITCHVCGEYAEIFVPPPPDYWKLTEMRRQGMIELLENGAEKAALQNKRYLVQTRIMDINAEYFRKTADIQTVFKYAKMKIALDKVLAESKDNPITDEMKVGVSTSLTFDEKKELFVFRANPILKADSFDRLRDCFDALSDGDADAWKSRILLNRVNAIYQDMDLNKDDSVKDIREVEQKYANERDEAIAAQHAEERQAEKEFSKSVSEKIKKVKQATTADELDLISKSMETPKELSLSTKYFACQNKDCTGAQCIACDKLLKKEDLKDHVCAANEVLRLFFLMSNTLATAATRVCRNCQSPGMKDLACIHLILTFLSNFGIQAPILPVASAIRDGAITVRLLKKSSLLVVSALTTPGQSPPLRILESAQCIYTTNMETVPMAIKWMETQQER
jgi:hypothetical protein